STGGRQGYLLAQELADELDGILAGAPAIYWTRFQTAQMWGQIVMKQLVGGPIAPAKLAQTAASAIQACDANDGVTDGVIDEPRTCAFKAEANVCGAPNAPAQNCLTAAEAAAVDKIWDGPRNEKGDKVWFGLDPGTAFSGLDGTTPFALGVTQFQWDEHDLNFSWTTVTPGEYPKVAQDGSQDIADVTDTFGPLDRFKAHGGKLLTYVGGNDQLIYPRGVINYYRQMASRYSGNGKPDFINLQSFYRLFRAPGMGHCGGGVGPAPVDPFDAVVNWVEHGVPPQTLLASGGSAAPASGRTRPLCPYPQTAIYNGSGDINSASSFHCGGDLETPQVVCKDILVRYKHEAHGVSDFDGSGLQPGDCHVPPGHEEDDGQ
ncbi:MAG: tannase/feruloyl esterase family alpha/beta hydrolase, partial [Bradyrhizobiaceae bacterium]|nr:tannase/feruloyl esterase family alpha/beta hydrolase [Bradyrhizobiaceae bacterium]